MTHQCRLFLEFLEVALDHGVKNGDLKASYRSLHMYGLDFNLLTATIQEAIDLGLVEKTFQGKGGTSSRFRVLHRPDNL